MFWHLDNLPHFVLTRSVPSCNATFRAMSLKLRYSHFSRWMLALQVLIDSVLFLRHSLYPELLLPRLWLLCSSRKHPLYSIPSNSNCLIRLPYQWFSGFKLPRRLRQMGIFANRSHSLDLQWLAYFEWLSILLVQILHLKRRSDLCHSGSRSGVFYSRNYQDSSWLQYLHKLNGLCLLSVPGMVSNGISSWCRV